MAYLRAGGADLFRDDTKKVRVQVGGYRTVTVGGPKIQFIFDALLHYEAVRNNGADEVTRALCLIISRCHEWLKSKAEKLGKFKAAGKYEGLRPGVVRQLLQEAVDALYGQGSVDNAQAAYAQRKNQGARATGALHGGYATERVAYLSWGKTKSVAGSLIADLVESNFTRARDEFVGLDFKKMSGLKKKYKDRDFNSITPKEWMKIRTVAVDLEGHRHETRYMTKRERMQYMLESDGNGGLRYVMGQRSAYSKGDQWPYAMDEWGNIYTADDLAPEEKGGYGLFNHSTFTAGDVVVCAGMLSISSTGVLTRIDNSSGHYQPTRAQLEAAVTILRDDYNVSLNALEILLKTGSHSACSWPISLAGVTSFLNGEAGRNL